MVSCAECKDANFCYYPGGAPRDYSCDNWAPSNDYKAREYDKRYSDAYINITYPINSAAVQIRKSL